jgi:pilus assembly protein CpaE
VYFGQTIMANGRNSDAAAGTGLRVCIVLDPATASLLGSARLSMPATEIRVHGGTLASFAADASLPSWTEVLICQVDPENPRGYEEFERFVQENVGRLPVVAAVRDLTVAMTRQILRSHAVDVLPLPFTPDELHQAIETGRDKRVTARPEPKSQSRGGRVVTMIGSLGGVGTTALAVQAGMIWAEKKKVCLIDLDVQFGNVALYLNMRPQLTLGDLVDAADRLDPEFLKSVADMHPSGMSVIACPPDIVPLDALTPEFVDKLLEVATQAYDIVVLDLPTAWVGWSLGALQRSDAICLVTAITVPGIHQARRQLEMIDANGLSDRIQLVANRVTHSLFGKLDLSETESVLRRKINLSIVNDYPTMAGAINEGKSISAIKVKSRIEKDVRTLVQAVTAQVSIEATVR